MHKTPNKELGKFKFLIGSIKAGLQVGYKYVDIERKLIEFLEQIEENQNPTNAIVQWKEEIKSLGLMKSVFKKENIQFPFKSTLLDVEIDDIHDFWNKNPFGYSWENVLKILQ